MASGSNPSTSQKGTPSSTRLANIPEGVVGEAIDSLTRNISPKDDDNRIKKTLNHVWLSVQDALEHDPKLKKLLASKEEFNDNVSMKGEKIFIDLLRAMATESEKQGSKAWEHLFEDGRYIVLFASKHSDCILLLEVFLKKKPLANIGPSPGATTSEQEGIQSLQSLSTLL